MEPGFVYLLEGERPPRYLTYRCIKIGKSHSPQLRAKDFSGYPFPVKLIHQIATNNMSWLETKLHQQHDSDREHGEWFTIAEQSLQSVLELKIVDRVTKDDFALYNDDELRIAFSPTLEQPLGQDQAPPEIVETLRSAL